MALGRLAAALLCAPFFSSAAISVQADVVNATGAKTVLASSGALPELQPHKKVVAVDGQKLFAGLQKGTPHPYTVHYPDGRFLSRRELAPIDTIACLQYKQAHPNKPCPKLKEQEFELGPLSIAHYPHYTDRICHSSQDFFCDPTNLLTPAAQLSSSESLRLFKERTLVNCGQLEAVLDPDVERRWYEKKHPIMVGRLGHQDYREFNLAVALADEWPSTERDPMAMTTFGWRVMSEWGLQPIYNGVDNGNTVSEYRHGWNGYRRNCPTTAVLIILPRYHQAFLTSPSCEFICQTKGGPEVVAATLNALDRGGLEAAIKAGIDEVQQVLKATIPRSIETKYPDTRWRSGFAPGSKYHNDTGLLWTMRILFAFVLFILVFAVGSFLYVVFVPEEKQQRARHLAHTNDCGFVKKSIQAEYA